MATNQNAAQSHRFLVIGGYAVVIIAFLLCGVLPVARGITATKAQIAEYESEISNRRAERQQLEDAKKLVDSITLETSDFNRLVPQEQNLSTFLLQVNKEWDTAGMRDFSVRSLPPTPLGRSQKLPIEIRGKGSYAQFHAFLERLENLERLSSVGRLAVDADTTMNGTVDVQLTLFIYYTKSASQ